MSILDQVIKTDLLDAVRGILPLDDNGLPLLRLITFKTLHCNETEDLTGADEAYLEVYLGTTHQQLQEGLVSQLRGIANTVWTPGIHVPFEDGSEVHAWGWSHDGDQTINDNDDDNTASVNKTYPLLKGIPLVVKLFDGDSHVLGDDDDLLGVNELKAETVINDKYVMNEDMFSRGFITFTRDGADYYLTYELHTFRLLPEQKQGGGIKVPGGITVPEVPSDPVKAATDLVNGLLGKKGSPVVLKAGHRIALPTRKAAARHG